ncbi:hypothetical protein PPERSA_07741 [Pseudocohnilembus persalinus]|uniref:Oxysterol-binding protein n=1 Tax=Pseudocohnilembus persalinus TaxID=266149 RepID=A0A0V0RA21_PSEPJ|nr:hypothetical protein PPERSA_07741 [Pseudocohnilembus persalinus]|eukprot:KRX11216.1 hypothetical protein PPERSA_07741 [Pseudocohnilembus persalinus]
MITDFHKKIQQQQQQKFDPNTQYPRNPQAYKEGGIHNSIVKQKMDSSVGIDYMKQIGKKVTKGEISNINTLSKPIKLVAHQTTLEVAALDNVPTEFLDLAQQATEARDPIARLQYIAAFTFAAQLQVPAQIYTKVPMDPVARGETVQLEKKQSGAKFYGEAIRLWPSQNLIYAVSKNKEWIFEQNHILQGFLDFPKMNSLTGKAFGSKFFKFRESDGSYTTIEAQNGTQKIEGLIIGERLTRPTGNYKIIDKKNKLVCEVKYQYEKKSTLSKIGGFFSSKEKKSEEIKNVEKFEIEIYKVMQFDGEEQENQQKTVLSQGYGNYNEYLQMDGKIFWTSDMKFEPWAILENNNQLLKSDTTWRESKTFVQMEDFPNAEKVRNQETEREAQDEQLRIQARQKAKENGASVLEPAK